jgi:PAS domain S-box-containing protein
VNLSKLRFKLGFLRSKVAQRIFCLFVFCALLPLSALAYFSFRHVTAQLYQQAEQRLRQANKAAGMTIFERLLFLETDLKMLISSLRPEAPGVLGAAIQELHERLISRFTGLVLVGSSGQTLVALGQPPPLPQLSPAEQHHLAAGKTLVTVRPHPDRFARVYIARALDPAQPAQGLLVGEIHPAFLWGDEDSWASTSAFFVFNQAHDVLFASLPDKLPVQELRTAMLQGSTWGRFAWAYADDIHLASYWTLFLQPRFFTPAWILVHSQSRADILEPLRHFTKIFLGVTLLSFWVILLLSFSQIRRQLAPIELLREATRRIAAQDLSTRVSIKSNDEFAELGMAFNEMVESLGNSEKRYRDLVENSPGTICMHDLDGTLLFVNRAWAHTLGYEPADVVGHSLGAFLAPSVRHLFADYLERVRQEATADGLARLVTRGGKELLWMYRSLRYEEAGKRPYVIGYAQDITERKQLEAQVRQAQKLQALGTLAGGIAHDFNNILTAILGYTELTMDDVAPDSCGWQNLQEVYTAGERAKELVQQILTFSRQTESERKPVRLHLLVKEVLKLMRASLPTTIDMRSRIDTTSDVVLADPTQMHQVLMNLCTNARHAMRETGGVLEVRLEAVQVTADDAATHSELTPGPYLRLLVRDTGHGMTPEVMERIFEPFFTTKGVGEGTGMGLAVVHGIIASHSGAITVTSAPGQGTTFEVYLPRSDAAIASETRPQEPLPRGEERLLFVDDENTLVRLWQATLEHLGYEVVVSTDGLAALETFRAAPYGFDLVITDHTMPRMTGEVLAQELRRLRPDIPIVLCTGFSHTMTAEKAQALGLDAFLMKPFTPHDLSYVVRGVLDRRTEKET